MWISISIAAVAVGIVLAVMTTGGDAPADGESTTLVPAVTPAAAPPAAEAAPIPPPTASVPPTVEPEIEVPIEPTVEPAKTVERAVPKTKTSPHRKKKPKSPGSLYDEWD